jgi:hypothetical protein
VKDYTIGFPGELSNNSLLMKKRKNEEDATDMRKNRMVDLT